MRKDTLARELTMEVVVGVFIVMILLGLGYFTIILSRTTLGGQKFPMEVVFKDVMGLREGDNVVVRGMPAGRISGLMLQDDGVHVQLELDSALHMKKDYRITIVLTSMLGGRHLQIDEGSENWPDVPMHALFRGEQPYDLMTDASELVNQVKKSVIEGGTVQNLEAAAADFREIAADFREIMARVKAGKGTLGRLLSEDEDLYDDVAATASSVREIAEKIQAGEGTIGRLMSADDTLYDDLSASMAALREIVQRVQQGRGTVGRLLSEDEQFYEDMSAAVASLREISGRLENGEGTLGKLFSRDDRLYDDLSAAVGSLRRLSESIEKGEGLLGKLATDDSLYHEIEATVKDIRGAIDDLRETSPVVTFTSVFFGAF